MSKNDLIESLDYKDYKINVYQDMDYQSPELYDGNEYLFLTAYHRDFAVDSKIISKAECVALATGDYEDDDDLKARCEDIKKQYHYFGLEAYIHSGVRLALNYEGNFADRSWDVSQLGMIFASKKEYKTRDKAKQAALSLIEIWNDDLSGNVYGYTISRPNENDNELGGRWGYYGDYNKSGLIESAQAEIRDDIIAVKAEKKAKIDNYNNLLALFAGQKTELAAYLDKYFTDAKLKADLNRNLNSIKSIITKKI